MLRRILPLLSLSLAAPALAQDADGDGVANASDAFPCDAARASVSYFPGETSSALLAFEDQWPSHTDVDYNDVAVRVHLRLERNAAGNVVQLVAVIDPVALGGDFSNGLGLVLPTGRTGVTARRRVGGGAWQDLALEADANATLLLSSNLRELFGSAPGRINSRANEARVSGQRLELEVTFATPAAISQAAAPFDVFVFRAGNPGHQIHFPQYAGTAAMNAALFNTDQDGSTSTRRFVHVSGVPAALNLMTTTRYPLEGVGISALFPDIAGFASSGGASNASFYATNVVAAQGHDVAALALPAVAAASVACLQQDGSTSANAAPSCLALRNQGQTVTGTYWIAPNGVAAFRAYCEMQMGGGGWTLIESLTRDHPLARASHAVIGFSANQPLNATSPGLTGDFRMSYAQMNATRAVATELAATTAANGFTRDYFITRQGRDRMYDWGATKTCYYCAQDQLMYEELNFRGTLYTSTAFSTWTAPTGHGWPSGGHYCVDDPRIGVASGDYWGFNNTQDGNFAGHASATAATHYWLR